MRILLVEDEPSAARFIAKGLREASYAVDVARDGSAAAELCVENDYDAVVLDVMLPKKDGVTLCRELRADGSDVPILMLTARDAVESRVEGLDAGADGYLTKPFDFRELLARVRALTRRGAASAGQRRSLDPAHHDRHAVASRLAPRRARSRSPRASSRFWNTSRAASERWWDEPTSPSTSGTSTTTRSRTSSTSTCSACAVSSTIRAASRSFGHGVGRDISSSNQ